MSRIVALLTDFGLEDTYVGTMKAVILGIAPQARIVDITHAIQPQSVREGAFALLNSYRYFPDGTIFCVVVDPGVGSARLPIAVKSSAYRFVAPDNGVLSYALADLGCEAKAVKLTSPQFRLPNMSYTFHGRDIFAPAAAHLALDRDSIDRMGDPIEKMIRFPKPRLSFARQRLIGEVMHIDHFGNIITSIGALLWNDAGSLEFKAMWNVDIPPTQIDAGGANITIHSHTIHGISRAYHEVPVGSILAQVDSNGFLEIGANQDNAAARLDVQLGDQVMLRLV